MKRLVLRSLLATTLVVGMVTVPVRAVAPVTSPGFQPIEPRRILDTREVGTPFADGRTRPLDLSSLAPAGVTGVALNIAGLEATEPTAISAWPNGAKQPLTSVVNVAPGSVNSNLVLLALRDDRIVNLHNYRGSTHVVVDVVGWFTGDFMGMTPVRAVDSRSGYGTTSLEPGAIRNLPLGGLVSLPPEAAAVAINATFIAGASATSVALGPTDQQPSGAQLVDLAAGQILTQAMVVRVVNGSLIVTNGAGPADIVLDVTGWFRSDGSFALSAPTRVLDTSAKVCGATVGPSETRTVRLTQAADVGAATVSVRAAGASEPTFLTVWRTGAPRPATSNVNVMPGMVASNLALVEVGPAGQIEIYNNSGSVEITVDVVGTFRGTTPAGEPTPCPTPPPPPPPPPRPKAPATTAAPPTTAAPATTAAPPPPPPSSSWQSDMLAAINKLRTDRGLVPLAPCGALNRSSQSFADVLVTTGGISHTGPDGSDLRQRVGAAGYNGWMTIGENLAAGQGTVAAVMDAWVKSPGHLANLVKPEFRHVGFGRQMGLLRGNTNQSWFWVQNFGASGSC